MKKTFFLKNLFIFLIPPLIPLLVLGAISIINIQHYAKEEINKNNVNLLKQTKENIELILTELDSLNLHLSSDPKIVYQLKEISSRSILSYEDQLLFAEIRKSIDAPVYARPYINSIYIYFKNDDNNQNRFFSTTEGLIKMNESYDSAWYNSYLEQNDNGDIWVEARQVKRYSFEKPLNIITIYRNIFLIGMKNMGVIVLNINADYLEKQLNNLDISPDQSIIITNENNQTIFSHNKHNYINSLDINTGMHDANPNYILKTANRSYAISQIPSTRYKWRYISIIPQDILYRVSIKLFKLTLFVLLCAMTFGIVLTYYLTRKNYRQIRNIISILSSAESNKPLPPLPDIIKDEYGYIVHNILKTFIEQSYLKVQLSEKKYKFQVMELIALQSQINPHFLYNTLHSIYWETFGLTGKQNKATMMLENLTDILEYSLSNPNKTVTLEEEIKNTMCYVEIQKARYSGRFEILWEYEDNIINYKVIKLLLQPLIENSIYHGIKEKEGQCCIKIKLHKVQNNINISVIDNGIGIAPDKLEAIKKKFIEEGDFSEHIGLYNTNKRLKLSYGEKYGLALRSKYKFGTAVYISIPCES